MKKIYPKVKALQPKIQVIALATSVVAMLCGLYGCSAINAQQAPEARQPGTLGAGGVPKINAEAGVEITPPATGLEGLVAEAKSKNFGARNDPFRLLPAEQRFEKDQARERVIGSMGGFSMLYEPPDPKPVEEAQIEPHPFRRLAGVIIGDAIYALLDVGARDLLLIRPGMMFTVRVGQTDVRWLVVSIDETKAVLRRQDNKLPKEVNVYLQSRREEAGGGAGAGGAGGGAGAAGGGGAGAAGGPGRRGTGPGGAGE